RTSNPSGEAVRQVPYKGHSAPITAISTHPSPGAISFSCLFLTSSLDWTIRLWSTREQRPLQCFDDYFEYVYDVQWSPVHPALFAAVDGSGHLDIWNLNQDVEVPVVRRLLGEQSGACASVVHPASIYGSVQAGSALNRCRWDVNGQFLAAGDRQGRVTVCSVHESLAIPGPEAWSSLAHTMAELKSFRSEAEARLSE
ncbi:unnamed protein product, partial [Protopolystoma xenopodis]